MMRTLRTNHGIDERRVFRETALGVIGDAVRVEPVLQTSELPDSIQMHAVGLKGVLEHTIFHR